MIGNKDGQRVNNFEGPRSLQYTFPKNLNPHNEFKFAYKTEFCEEVDNCEALESKELFTNASNFTSALEEIKKLRTLKEKCHAIRKKDFFKIILETFDHIDHTTNTK